jgi:hypothetical protein
LKSSSNVDISMVLLFQFEVVSENLWQKKTQGSNFPMPFLPRATKSSFPQPFPWERMTLEKFDNQHFFLS